MVSVWDTCSAQRYEFELSFQVATFNLDVAVQVAVVQVAVFAVLLVAVLIVPVLLVSVPAILFVPVLVISVLVVPVHIITPFLDISNSIHISVYYSATMHNIMPKLRAADSGEKPQNS